MNKPLKDTRYELLEVALLVLAGLTVALVAWVVLHHKPNPNCMGDGLCESTNSVPGDVWWHFLGTVYLVQVWVPVWAVVTAAAWGAMRLVRLLLSMETH